MGEKSDPSIGSDPDRPSLGCLLLEFVIGAGFLALGVATYVFDETRILLAGMAAGALYDLAIMHYAFTPRDRATPRQFRLVSLFGYTAIVAMLLGLSRWVASTQRTAHDGLGGADWERVFAACVGLNLLGLLLAVPMGFFMRSIAWLAAAIVGRLRGRRGR